MTVGALLGASIFARPGLEGEPMFPALKAEFTARIMQVDEVFRIMKKLEDDEVNGRSHHPGLKSLKGIMFVQMYAVYEFIVTQSFATLVKIFNSYLIPLKDTRISIIGLALHPQFQSLVSLSERRSWLKKIELLDACDSNAASFIQEGLFPMDETHFRQGQLETICSIVGLPSGALLPDPRFIGWVRELVEHRNAIAHGRETAEAIGSRYTYSEIEARGVTLNVVCNHILATLENHASTPVNFSR
jgi:hypothetical protein